MYYILYSFFLNGESIIMHINNNIDNNNYINCYYMLQNGKLQYKLQ
jgi:hypothetical protein